MKKALTFLLILAGIFIFSVPYVDAYVSVKGYYKSNGTYVAPYVRSNPNGLKYDNYSYTPSQGLYNSTYGTRSSYWDTPTYITDPNYYLGKSIYNSGNINTYYPTTPTCPTNSYYDGISSCTCSYGYVSSGGICVSGNSTCYSQTGYNSSYDSVSKTCKCNSGYVIGSSGQCVGESVYYNSQCANLVGIMSKYNSFSKQCECLSGYEYNGSSCVYKSTTYSGSSASTYSSCPLNSHLSTSDLTKCECNSGYQVNSTKTACVSIYSNTVQYTPPKQDDKTIGTNYYLSNKTCVGLSGNQYSECISYAYNH
jgi:hypothetical protein